MALLWAVLTTAALSSLLAGLDAAGVVPHKLNNEKRLIQDLLNNYQVQFGRPVNNMTEKVAIYFGLYLIQLIDLDERNQVLITNVHSIYQWKDNGLKWNKTEYGDVDEVRLPIDKIWTPDIVLYNYADTRLEEKRKVLAIVQSDGTIKWRPPSIFKSTCQIDIEKFPYDKQNCTMKFGSWTYAMDSIDILFYEGLEEINRQEYIESNEWEIESSKGERHVKRYECCKEMYPDITFYIIMKRKGGFYNYILVLPCVLLSCLTTVLFWLPPESPAKMVLGMNIFTSFFVLLLLLSKNVPSATDKIPLIGAYYCLNMVMIATSTCSCTAVVHIFFRGQGQVPWLLRKIFLEFLARVFCMVTPPVLPPAPAYKKQPLPLPGTKMGPSAAGMGGKPAEPQSPKNAIPPQQATQIITSAQSNGSLMHHPVMRGSMNNRLLLSQNMNSVSCTALNTADETTQLLMNHPGLQQVNAAAAAFLAPGSPHLALGDQQSGAALQFPLTQQYQQRTTYQYLPSQQQQQQQQQQQTAQSNMVATTNNANTNTQLANELSLSFNLIENDIKEIRDYLRHTRKKLETTDAKAKQTNEWKQVALVLDRTLFFFYIIAIIVSVALLFPRSDGR